MSVVASREYVSFMDCVTLVGLFSASFFGLTGEKLAGDRNNSKVIALNRVGM